MIEKHGVIDPKITPSQEVETKKAAAKTVKDKIDALNKEDVQGRLAAAMLSQRDYCRE